jgi:hypothetical protein
MSIRNAITFIGNADTDAALRKSCLNCRNQNELLDFLRAQELDFTPDEFDDAVNHLLIQCQTYAQAHRIREWQVWFHLFPTV